VVPGAQSSPCSSHERLLAELRCPRCDRPACALCAALAGGEPLCAGCAGRKRFSRAFYLLRVTTLLFVLAGVLLYAWNDVRQRRARTEWARTLDVAVVLVRLGNVAPAAIDAVKERAPALSARLEREMRRYRPVGVRPFELSLFGPVDAAGPPPSPAGDAGLAASASYAWSLWRYVSGIDDRAGLLPRRFDARIYVVVRPPSGKVQKIEGSSEQNGRVGVVEVQLDKSMADFALFVAAHELFHTLGATDKYNPDGSIMMPEGIAEPDRRPLFPQTLLELMARHRPVDAAHSVPPDSLAELCVGAATAREIGWLAGPAGTERGAP
jgi:hypothetical protein